MSIVSRLKDIGERVDPIIEKYLLDEASEDFKPILLYQIKSGGKRIRPALTILCCEAVGGNVEDSLNIAAAMEMIHNYSLIFDDIIDKGEIRRGLPTVRKKYGDTMAILAAVHYREAIAQAVNSSKNSKLLHELVASTVKRLTEGERLDVLFEQSGRSEEYILKHRYNNITLDDYLKMISYKTAELIKTSCLAGGIVAGARKELLEILESYGYNVGMAFQIIDDILDIFGEEKKFGKKIGKDIIEHKLGNIVILLSIMRLEEYEKKSLKGILRKDMVSEGDVRVAIDIISKTDARNVAYNMARKHIDNAINSIKKLEESRARDLLKELAIFVIKREF